MNEAGLVKPLNCREKKSIVSLHYRNVCLIKLCSAYHYGNFLIQEAPEKWKQTVLNTDVARAKRMLDKIAGYSISDIKNVTNDIYNGIVTEME